MPRRKGKKQKTKTELSEKLKQKRAMDKRLMVINLKIDDYVYKKKPISIEQANMYARELEQYGLQCRDQRSIQVIEKLNSYMKCIIREKSPKDITHSVISSMENTTEKLNNENEYSMQADDISRFSSLSIVEPKDPLNISDVNNNTYQEKGQIENSTLTNEKPNEGNNPIIFSSEIIKTTPEMENLQNTAQKESTDGGSKHSEKILNNLEYGNYSSELRSYRKTKNDQTVKTRESNKNMIINHGTMNIKNSINNTQTSNLNLKDVDDDGQLSPNLLSNFENENFTALNINHKNVIFQSKNVINTPKCNDTNKINIITSLNEVSDINTIKLKYLDISTDQHVLSQNPCNFEYRNTNAVSVYVQNNTNFNNVQHNINIPNIIADTTNNATNYNHNMNPECTNRKFEISSLSDRNEIGRECELKQNLPTNFEQVNCDSIQINLKNTQTFKTPFASKNHSQYQGNGIEKVKKRRKCVRKDKVGATRNTVNVEKNNSQNQATGIEKVKKQRKRVNRDIAKTRQMTEFKQNLVNLSDSQFVMSKEIVNSYQTTTNFVNSDSNIRQKKQSKLLNNKREVEGLSWVDSMKFLRVIENEEFTMVDNLDESFWNDTTIPPNIINLNDFECDDNISIWK